MLDKRLGKLTVILGANDRELQKKLKDSAGGLSNFRLGVMKAGRGLSDVGKTLSIGVTAPIAAFSAAASVAASSLSDLSNQASLAGMGVQQFKVMALASKEFGVEQDKLSDVLKDVNDKMGDYFQTGGGPLADFFENIAPKVNLTSEAFRGLSSDQALRLYVKALEEANVSQADMTFYMEAIASDSTALLPLLRDNGAAIDEMAKRASELGLSLDEGMIKKARQAKLEMGLVGDVLRTNFQAALVEIVPTISSFIQIAMPAIQGFSNGVSDLAARFGALSPQTQKFVVAGTAIAAALGPAAIVIGGVVAAVGALMSPVVLTVAAIGALALAGYKLWKNWGDIVERFPVIQSAFDVLSRTAFLPIVFLVRLGRKVVEVVKTLGGFGETFVFLKDLSAEVWERMSILAQGFEARFEAMVQKVKSIWASGVAYLAGKWSDFVGSVAPTFNVLSEKSGAAFRIDAIGTSAWASGMENAARNAKTLAQNSDLAADAMIALGGAPLVTLQRLQKQVGDVGAKSEDTGEAVEDELNASLIETGTLLDDLEDKSDGFGKGISKGARDAKDEVESLGDALQRISTDTLKQSRDDFFGGLSRGDPAAAFGDALSTIKQGGQEAFSTVLSDAFSKGGGGFSAIGTSLSGAWSGVKGALSGGLSFAGIGGAVSAALPIIGALTAVFTLIKGFSSKTLMGSGLQLGVGADGLTGGTFETWKKTSFWGLLSRTRTSLTAFDEETRSALEDQVSAVRNAVEKTYKAADHAIEEGFVAGFNYDFGRIETKGLSEDEVREKIEEAFTGYGDAISEAIGGVALDVAATFAEAKAILEPSGQGFVGVFSEMAEAATSLSQLFGGTQGLSASVASFVDTFYSEAERFDMLTDRVADVFDDLGLSVPTSLRAFRELVMSQDLMTASGRETYAALLGISDGFATLKGDINALSGTFDPSGWYRTEFEAKLAQSAAANGFVVETMVARSSGTMQIGETRITSEELGNLVELQKRMVQVLLDWEESGMPADRGY